MKIALLMSGQTRTFWYTMPSIFRNIIEPNNADVFLYIQKNSASQLPKEIDEEFLIRDCFGNHIKGLKFDIQDSSYAEDFNYYQDRYIKSTNDYYFRSPAKEKKLIDYYDYKHHFGKPFIIDQYLRVKKCAEMIQEYEIENNFKYDMVARIRIDVAWLSPLDISSYDISKSCLYINHRILHALHTNKKFTWAVEHKYLGDRDTIVNTSLNVIDFLGTEIEPCLIFDNHDVAMLPEVQFGKYIEKNNIDFKIISQQNKWGKFFNMKMNSNHPYFKYITKKFGAIENVIGYVDSSVDDERLNSDTISVY